MRSTISGLLAVFAVTVLAVSAFAQRETLRAAAGDKYVISATAGGINLTEGTVTVHRVSGKSGALLKGDSLEIGDQVSTGANGRVEVLLNPGSYVRLGGNSTLEFVTTDLEDLKVRLNSGRAMFEVFAANDFAVNVETPNGTFKLVDSGIYRVDSGATSSSVRVWDGRAVSGDSTAKDGRMITVGASRTSVAKFDKDERDSLAMWSKDRAREVARVSTRLKRDNLRPWLINAFDSNRWNLFDSFGLWVYDPFWHSYCFLPFGYGWSSPYGYGFGYPIWYYNLPPYIIHTQPQQPPVLDPRTSRRRDAIRLSDEPPYIKMQGAKQRPRPNINDETDRSPTFIRVPAPIIAVPATGAKKRN